MTHESPGGRAVLAGAWVSLLFIPVAFAVAFAVAEGLYGATGYDPGSGTVPHWADAVALIPAGLVFAIPCVSAVIYGHRAVKEGHPSGYVPVVIAVVVALGYAVLNVL